MFAGCCATQMECVESSLNVQRSGSILDIIIVNQDLYRITRAFVTLGPNCSCT